MISVTENNPVILAGAKGISFFPSHHNMLNTSSKVGKFTITDTLIYSQIRYLYYMKVGKKGIKPSHHFLRISFSSLQSEHFSWLTTRTIIRSVQKLKERKLLSVSNNSDVNRYSNFPDIKSADESFILFYPLLAQQLDNDVAALLLQRIHFVSRFAGFIDISYPDLVSLIFNIASLSTIIRSVKLLVMNGLLSQQPSPDHEKHVSRYQINYMKLQLIFESPTKNEAMNNTTALPNC